MVGVAVGATRFIIVIQKIRQLRIQKTAIRFTILSALGGPQFGRFRPAARL
jgi:hypothetical protein